MTFCFGTATILNWENLNQQIPAIFIIANQEVLVFTCGTALLFLQKKLRRTASISINFTKILLSGTTHEFRYLFGTSF